MKKKASALVLAGLISAQPLVPAMTTFADEIEKTNVGNEQVQNQVENNNQGEQDKEEDTKKTDSSEVDNSKDEKQELENKEVVDNSKTQNSEKTEENGSTYVMNGKSYVNIPDINLRKKLNKHFGLGEVDNPIPEWKLDSLSFLDADNAGIESLEGLEVAKKLKDVRLNGNNISDISPLSGASSNLSSLDLSNNNISDISPLSGASNLSSLNLSNNNISDISPLSGASNLSSLNLSNNNISDISRLPKPYGLRELILNDNNISDISLLSSGFELLKKLVLDNNHISNIQPLRSIHQGFVDISILNQTITGIELDNNNVVENMVKDRFGKFVEPTPSNEYSYSGGKITFNNISNRDVVSYSFDSYEMVSIGGNMRQNVKFTGTVSHKTSNNNVNVLGEAELNTEKGGIMLSTAGLGLRLFTSLKNISSNEPATYYITTASNKSETPKFEVKSTVLNGDYSQIKTNIEFSKLSNLDIGVDTKLYVKRVVKGKEPTYMELKSSDDYLTNAFNISDNKSVAVSVTKSKDNVVQLNKSVISSNSFVQGVSNIYWNSTGMVVEGSPTNNGSSSDFNNAKVSINLKDSNGDYIKAEGTDKNLEVRGIYKDDKYKVTIPYNVLDNAKSFELRLIGSNIQTSDVLTKGTVQEFKTGMNGNKIYKLSEGTGNEVNLIIESLSNSSSKLSDAKVTTDKTKGIRQFSVVGNVSITGMDKIDSNVKYTIVGKKADNVVFEQSATKINNNGNYDGFKTNLSLTKLKEANLNKDEEISLELKVEYLGNTMNIELDSSQANVAITDKESKETFEIASSNGKAVIRKK